MIVDELLLWIYWLVNKNYELKVNVTLRIKKNLKILL